MIAALLFVAALQAQTTFTNPLLPSGPDPWVLQRDGVYYYMNTTGRNLTIRKTRSIVDLAAAEAKVVWRPPATGPYSHGIWAPELHHFDGKWYIYFAADAGSNETHRLWVLENASADPFEGEWVLKGKLADRSDKWAIDGSVFENAGRRYLIWSGWEGDHNGVQSIYIAELENPWTIKGHRVRISTPEYPWEKVGDILRKRDLDRNPGANLNDPPHADVNEGPQILRHGETLYLIYSASGCWTDYYVLGMLSASAQSDLLDAASWKKSPTPVFWQSPEAQAYGTGHNSFFQSPDGKEDWLLYHANPAPGQGCGGRRSPRAQRITWRPDGQPDFGRPIPLGVAIPRPSGEQ